MRERQGPGDVVDWYKDAIIYELHIKAFQDSTGDGIGDFGGLIQRLDYLAELGVTAIWLLPFYPSPLRDDGYDIADYRTVNPSYGTLEEFDRFLDEAHQRGMRVITELVINHTSDQHPWFQRAREAPPGSPERDYYVWSDSDDRYAETRIIFIDTETSNWTWDPVAKAYFWHRFYGHQPDLNFDNPRVFDEIVDALDFWLSRGVDGLRLDAVPYLCERDGTINENLPETHDVLKRLRREIDARYPGRMLLAEANQWPEDTRPYFGEGDECHMAFHFPLMPRMYMALAQEDRHPVTDIIRQTPAIPEACQWAIFLRNHDELTLEMVTDEERDYLWQTYASELRARLNLGIRRRLAPLLENDRRKIELMNGLLFSMDGTPVVYYGDEIGMGDNFYLGDRDGVRTPMQWSDDRNGAFSRCDPQRLYLPPLMDPVYGYQAINVEAQQKNPSSLLNWMKRMISVRRDHAAFSRGSLTILYPSNRKALAYVREYDDEKILCVANLARSAQAVQLDLSPWRGSVPVELLGRSAFPPVGELPYLLTLPAYGFYWFLLASEGALPQWYEGPAEPLPEFITLVVEGDWREALHGRQGERLAHDVLPHYLARQRWYAAKDSHVAGLELAAIAPLSGPAGEVLLAEAHIELEGGERQRYLLPLSADWSAPPQQGSAHLGHTLARLRRTARLGALLDGGHDERVARVICDAIRLGCRIERGGVSLAGLPRDALAAIELDDGAEIRSLGGEQSNTSFVIGEALVLKIYRRLHGGLQPDLELSRFLTEDAFFGATPAYLGALELADTRGDITTLATLHAFVRNQGDAWTVVVEALAREIEQRPAAEPAPSSGEAAEVLLVLPLDIGTTIGRRTAELHAALGRPSRDPALGSEAVTADDLGLWVRRASEQVEKSLETLQHHVRSSDETGATAADLVARRGEVEALFDRVGRTAPQGRKQRIHGDFHLGQVLVTQSDVVIVDFEGEPMRPLEERREKASPLRDVAGMLRSLDYAAWASLDRAGGGDGERERLAQSWRRQASDALLAAYFGTSEGPSAEQRELLDLFTLHKAFYEIAYEAANRPSWLSIPLRGVLRLLDRHRGAA